MTSHITSADSALHHLFVITKRQFFRHFIDFGVLSDFEGERKKKKIFLFQTSMAFSSSIFSVTQFSSSLATRPSSAISRQTRFPAQITSPDLSPALFDDRRKFVGGVMSLLTKRLSSCLFRIRRVSLLDLSVESFLLDL